MKRKGDKGKRNLREGDWREDKSGGRKGKMKGKIKYMEGKQKEGEVKKIGEGRKTKEE